MAAFLKAEELASKECTESQIMGEMHKMQNVTTSDAATAAAAAFNGRPQFSNIKIWKENCF